MPRLMQACPIQKDNGKCRGCHHARIHEERSTCKLIGACSMICKPATVKRRKPKAIKAMSFPFDREEMLVLFEAAKMCMGDAEMLEELSEHLDLNDQYMCDLREKLNLYLNQS